MRNPDKWIRKYFANTLNGLTVNGVNVPIYDTLSGAGKAYIIMSTMAKEESNEVKCEMRWNCEITLDIVTIYDKKGSRVLVDDISEAVVNNCEDISIENFTVLDYKREYPADISVNTGTQSIFRKLIKYNLKLKQNGS